MAVIATPPKLQFFDANGNPLTGGKLYSYAAGTTTPLATFTDAGGATPNANPIILDSRGEASVWLGTALYKFKLTTSINVEVWTVDNVGGFATLSQLAASGGSALVGFLQAGAGAQGRTVQSKLRDVVSVKDFGAVGNGVANDTTAFSNALTYVKANNKNLVIPGGTYLLTSGSLNFAGQGLEVIGEGKPALQFTGAGRGFEVDGGSSGAGVGNMRIENLLIVGGANITDGFYKKGVFRSVFRNIEVRECNNNAFTILHGVSNQYDTLKYSTNEAAQTTKPSNGLVLNNNGAGYYTADCTFINCIMEGFPGKGCYIVDASGNVFVGGTFESVSIGLEVAAGCLRNNFKNVWFEANTTRDADLYGNSNVFDGCYFGSASSGNNIEVITADGTLFNGGFLRVVNMQVTSSDTLFVGVGLSDNVSLGFTGTGTYTRIRCTKLDINAAVTGTFNDIIGPVQAIEFSSTQVASANANTLDDYEEGTWTPVLTPAGGTITPNATYTGGTYTKVGNLVTVNGCVNVTSVSSPTGALTITGLPFLTRSGTQNYRAGSVYVTDMVSTLNSPVQINTVPASTTLFLGKIVNGVDTAMAADVKAASDIRFSITYQV